MNDLLLKVPKAELHLHLRGAMPMVVFTDLIQKYEAGAALKNAPEGLVTWISEYANIRPFLTPNGWTVDDVPGLFHSETFDQFLATWCFVRRFVKDASDTRRLIA